MYSTLLLSVSFPVFCSRTEFLPSPFLGFFKKKPGTVWCGTSLHHECEWSESGMPLSL